MSGWGYNHINHSSGIIKQRIFLLGRLMSLLVVAFTVLLERKLLGRVQLRTGPMNVRWIRVIQTVVDGIKLLTKRVIRSKVIFTSGAFVLTGVMINWNVSTI
jgi:NADH:ubiquinone oxidoreductase subunit H